MDFLPDNLGRLRLAGYQRLRSGRDKLAPYLQAVERHEWDAAARHAHNGVALVLSGITGALGTPALANEQNITGTFNSNDAEWKFLISTEIAAGRLPALNLEQREYTKAEAETAGETLRKAVALAQRLVVTYETRPIRWTPQPTKWCPVVGRCVYCGSTKYSTTLNQRLSNEHIIPEGLGGHLLLPLASCQKCEAITSRFERWCLRYMFGPLRIHCRLPSKRNDLPTKIRVIFDQAEGNPGTPYDVPAELYPVTVWCPLTGPPLLLDPTGMREGYNKLAIHCLRSSYDTQARSELLLWLHDKKKITLPPETSLLTLMRMYAKIAHCFLVSELGLGAFKPLLVSTIDGTDVSQIRDYFGNVEDNNSEKPKEGHSLTREVISVDGRQYHSVRIGLFSEYGLTAYTVIAGEVLV